MRFIATRNPLLLAIALLFLWIVGGCVPGQGTDSGIRPEGTFPVEVVFRELYNQWGGEKILGYAISPEMEIGAITVQYTQAALMRYDPQAVQKVSLAPIGLELNLRDQPIAASDSANVRLVDGFVIFDEFLPAYENLQGARFVGRPLTQPRIDYERGRIEQYFENVGFYRLVADPNKTIRLLSYGAWKCANLCRNQANENAQVAPKPAFAEPFLGNLVRLGIGFTGRALSNPYQAEDGKFEQVYENFVIAVDPNNLRMISLRPITTEAGYPATALVSKREDDRMVFYPIQPGLGHHVPKVFEEYITQHGGLELSGMPTTELFQIGDLYRQCFTNFCLDFDPGQPEASRIHPAPIGATYLKQHVPSQKAEIQIPTTSSTYQLKVWEAYTTVPSGSNQTIHLAVTETQSQNPAAGITASVTLFLPDGSQASYHFQASDQNGQSQVEVSPVVAPNATLVPYQVCLEAASTIPTCIRDSFVIWNKP